MNHRPQTLTTGRLTTAYYRAGEGNGRRLLLIHGNVSSGAFYLPLFDQLSQQFDVIAPDLRCFGGSSALAGWSMGGCVAMQYAMDHGEQLTGLILINPGSPYGFGGTKGEDGVMLEPPGLASGGGCVNAQLVQSLLYGEREFLRATLNSVYFKPPFRMDSQWEERLIDEMLKTKVGDGMYPGDTRQVPQWPFVAAGDKGVCNTMAPNHSALSALADAPVKPPVLWVRGDGDIMVSDTSLCDFGYLGQAGVVPGWPGAEVIPPQPMVAQTRAVLARYAANGGRFQEVVLSGGHGCHLESPVRFVEAVAAFVTKAE